MDAPTNGTPAATAAVREVSAGRATFSGLCASLVGIGLARFAYTPLIPALIAAAWFTPARAAYLGAANLAGYLAGALLAGRVATQAPVGVVLRAMMLLVAASFFACAFPLSFWWFFVWRFASGLAGGMLMVLGATAVLAQVPAARRGLAGGVIFTGVGLGIVASGTLVPLLLREGLAWTWFGLGALAVLLTLLAWSGWPERRAREGPPPAGVQGGGRPSGPALTALYAAYALIAVGLVPHMVFLVDFVARGLGRGIEAGAQHWVLFGLGAVTGPLLAGALADRIGFGRALRVTLLVQAGAVGLLALPTGWGALLLSSVLVGAYVPGVVPLVLGRIHDLVPPDGPGRAAAWGRATTAFALGQAGAAYGFSFLFARTDGYALLFGLGAAALLVALALELAAPAPGAARERPPRPPRG